MMLLRCCATAVLAFVACPPPAGAQSGSPLYAGGTLTALTQTRSETDRLGGTTWNGSVMFGGWVSPRIAVELEPSFGRTFSWQYSYRPGPSVTADVVVSRRDTFWGFQMRTRAGVIEPVFGVAYKHASVERHATAAGQVYFDDSRSENAIAAVAGLDAPVKVARHVSVLPTFRMMFDFGQRFYPVAPLDFIAAQANTGRVVLRYGAGARVTF
jgi:hypothetical protein